MEETTTTTQQADSVPAPAEAQGAATAIGKVSHEAIINVLVRKGVCTAEELWAEELSVREVERQQLVAKLKQVVKPNGDESPSLEDPSGEREKVHRTRTWYKRLLSQYRWTRWIGSEVFGIKWKKVKKTAGPLDQAEGTVQRS